MHADKVGVRQSWHLILTHDVVLDDPHEFTEDPFFIGRIERGFDFLGYHLTADSLTLAVGTMANFAGHVSRLYEQKQAGPDRPLPIIPPGRLESGIAGPPCGGPVHVS